MRVEIRRNIESCRETVISANRQYVQRPEISKVLQLIRDKGLKVDGRLNHEFKEMKLLNSGGLTADGEKAIKLGTVQMPEYGQYEFVIVNDDPWIPNSILSLKRNFAGSKKDKGRWVQYNRSYENQKVFDEDMGKPETLTQAITKSKKDSDIRPFDLSCSIEYEPSDSEFLCSISGQITWSSGEKRKISLDRQVSIDFDDLFRDIIAGYDPSRKVIVLDSYSELNGDDEKVTMRRNIKDIRENKDGYEYRYDMEDMPLVASDEKCAKSWVSALRRLKWKTSFIPVDQTYTDQEEWKKAIYSKGEFKPLEGVELLNDIKDDKRVYWNVAAMMDLVPQDSKLRQGFYVSKNKDITKELKKYLFTESVANSVKEIIVIDNYAECNLLDIIRRILPNCTRITLFSDPDKYKDMSAKLKERKINPESPPDGITWKPLRDNHDRYIIIKNEEGRIQYWSVSNSFDKFKITDGSLRSSDTINFNPMVDVDESIRKTVEGKK